jgi:hypothetical protein
LIFIRAKWKDAANSRAFKGGGGGNGISNSDQGTGSGGIGATDIRFHGCDSEKWFSS